MKLGSIFSLKFFDIPKSHPCVFLGMFGNKCVLLPFTSFKENEYGDWESYYTNKIEVKNIIVIDANIWYPFIHNDKFFFIELNKEHGFKQWSETDIRNLEYVDKNKLEEKVPLGIINEDGWNHIIQKYKEAFDILNKDQMKFDTLKPNIKESIINMANKFNIQIKSK